MEPYEKIRLMREMKKWSQEDMAEKLDMSAGGYAKIERGETRLNVDNLEKIAQAFQVNAWELLRSDETAMTLQINKENNNSDIAFYASSMEMAVEIEKLKLRLKHQTELVTQKEREISLLQDLVSSLKKQLS